ncbi:hypothetical protein [Cyclobacterium plantarum]|uniref:hypothetical protein n=1 Tax=Cyclobacterium plantarum TaxID=2716263 RepID=UPI003F6EE2B5
MRWLKWKMNSILGIAILLDVSAVSFYLLSVIKPSAAQRFFSESTPEYVNGVSVVLASLSGVLFVYVAFLGQRWQMLFQQQEIRDNRKEIRFSSQELRGRIETLTEQVIQMDGDVIYQNFFRMLDQWCLFRDAVRYSPVANNTVRQSGAYSGKKIVATREKAFTYFMNDLTHWVDDTENGWKRTMDVLKEKQFYTENGYAWQPRRSGLGDIGDVANLRFLKSRDGESQLTKNEITFIIRAVSSEKAFDTYLQYSYHLFSYMMEKKLSRYLPTLEAGMGKHERSFFFYQLVAQFDGQERIKIKEWLQ